MAFAIFNKTVTGTRSAGGSYVSGIWTPAARQPISVQASVQPASENELKLLPEGRRVDGAYTLRAKTEIKEQDIFTIYGDAHEVVKVQVWQNSIIPHWLGVAVRVQA